MLSIGRRSAGWLEIIELVTGDDDDAGIVAADTVVVPITLARSCSTASSSQLIPSSGSMLPRSVMAMSSCSSLCPYWSLYTTSSSVSSSSSPGSPQTAGG